MKTRNILLRFLNHLPQGNNEKKEEMNQKKMKPAAMTATQRPCAAMTAALPTPARTAPQTLSAAKAVHLIILLATLPLLLATSCRDRDDEPTAGPGKLITVTRLNVSIDAMHSAAEMNAARNATRTGNGGDIGNGGDARNDGRTHNGGRTRNGGQTRNGRNTRTDAPDDKGYVGVVKSEFVPGDVLHFVVAATWEDYDQDNYQFSNATLVADGNGTNTWRFDTPLVLPEDATETHLIEVFYDGTNRIYNSYDTDGDNTADDGNAFAAIWDARNGTKDGATDLTTYHDLLYTNVITSSGPNRSITPDIAPDITPDGTLTLAFEHDLSHVSISSIENRLGANVTAIRANTTDDLKTLATISLYPAPADASAAAASGKVEAIIGTIDYGSSYLQSFTVTLADGREFIVPVPKDYDDYPGRYLAPRHSFSYRLLLLPGSITAQEDAGTAPSYKVRRDPAVPAGYIPIYTKDDLRKIGQNAPAIVNGYLYTNASSAILAKDAQKDPIIYDIAKGIYTDSGYSQEATDDAIAAGGLDPTSDGTSDGSGSGTVGPLTFSLSARYILMNDIDLTPKAGLPNKDLSDIGSLGIDAGDLWKPIGKDQNNPFTGRFHGNGFTIRGMTIKDDKDAQYLGLFGFTQGAVIYNVHMKDARVKGTRQYGNFGSLVGGCYFSTISSCSATGCALQGTGQDANIGGLVGINDSATLTRCHATACALSGGEGLRAGGLVGYNTQSPLASCYTAGCTASCTGIGNSFGGLVGFNRTTIYGCYATYAQVTSGAGNFGSLVGNNFSNGTIASSYAINAANSTLGLVGTNYDGTITACVSPFQNAGSTGATSGSGGQDGGGGSYWEVISDGSSPTGHSGGYTPLTSAGNLADVRTLLVNNTNQDITTDMGGGDDYGTPVGALGKIPPGGLYTRKRTWTAIGIWGGYTTPGGPTVTLPRIDWTYDGKEKD